MSSSGSYFMWILGMGRPDFLHTKFRGVVERRQDNLKIEMDNLSEMVATLEATNELETNKAITFGDKYSKVKFNLMILWALFIGFLVALMTK
ncbi:hypothetical protein RND71_002021 [Anisodus tanguticus]|uniref:Uncharacterized protein n=1 Tax=Anisodus tanguticus TaxID=243964 RepID=A0AAE1T0C4_9SOLA|nr:hypothetical protein RND71_002021 [Anisodus tanguticus]